MDIIVVMGINITVSGYRFMNNIVINSRLTNRYIVVNSRCALKRSYCLRSLLSENASRYVLD